MSLSDPMPISEIQILEEEPFKPGKESSEFSVQEDLSFLKYYGHDTDKDSEYEHVENGVAEEKIELNEDEEDDNYIFHKVQKHDTVMSLAIKYNVSVLDLRRANNLLSDQSMYAKDKLLIPKKALPMDKETLVRAVQVMSGYDRQVHVGVSTKKNPGTSALMKQAGQTTVKEMWDEDVAQDNKFDFPGDIVPDQSILPSNGRDLELATYSSTITQKVRRIGEAAGGFFDDKIRRRQKDDSANGSNESKGEFFQPYARTSTVRERLSHVSQGMFRRTVTLRQRVGRWVSGLGRRVRSTGHQPRASRYAGLQEQAPHDPQSQTQFELDHQELTCLPSNSNRQSSSFTFKMSARAN
eukprot:TRINITY_DN1008_c0_g1_i1.p1 TRINITY_DN1008_c0_g1~~TRINITY_DN1008_c0_g1_i1.p1  ORF type:complete len:398 (-),score=29.10 TRINITY_DN1008_c0_g1_i1:641-1699(-)